MMVMMMMTFVYLLMKRMIETAHESRSGQNMLHLQRSQIFHHDWQNRIEKTQIQVLGVGMLLRKAATCSTPVNIIFSIDQQYEDYYNSVKQH